MRKFLEFVVPAGALATVLFGGGGWSWAGIITAGTAIGGLGVLYAVGYGESDDAGDDRTGSEIELDPAADRWASGDWGGGDGGADGD